MDKYLSDIWFELARLDSQFHMLQSNTQILNEQIFNEVKFDQSDKIFNFCSDSDLIRNILNPQEPLSLFGGSVLRIGSLNDGGYVIPELLTNNINLLSIGIGYNIDFELALLQNNANVQAYDHTIDAPGVSNNHNFEFFKLGVANKSNDSKNLISFSHIVANFWAKFNNKENFDRRNVLKIDVEGDEWDIINNENESTLTKFDALILEIHDFIPKLIKNRESVTNLTNILSRNFFCLFTHSNNCGPVFSLDGKLVPNIFEMTLLNKNLINNSVDSLYLIGPAKTKDDKLTKTIENFHVPNRAGMTSIVTSLDTK